MDLNTAIEFIKPAVDPNAKNWADIGAGTGLFCSVLDQLLSINSPIYAVDKNPHALYNLQLSANREFHIIEGNFEKALDIPICEGMLLANALHYASKPAKVLDNLFQYIAIGGQLIIIEYETEVPNNPWIPFPLPLKKVEDLLKDFPCTPIQEIGRVSSRYNESYMYAAVCQRL